jgi:hypothetical protein
LINPSLVSIRIPPRLIRGSAGEFSVSSGMGVVVVKYVISPHGWETLVSGREAGKGVAGIGSMLA